MADFTHFDADGKAMMVNVGAKDVTERVAVADARVSMAPETLRMIMAGDHKKGDVLGIARLAGIMAAKRTPDLIPLCHPLPLSAVEVSLTPDAEGSAIEVEAMVRTTAPTGVEMEALTAVSVVALTIYDMCKAVERTIRIEAIRLVAKSGGKSGTFHAE